MICFSMDWSWLVSMMICERSLHFCYRDWPSMLSSFWDMPLNNKRTDGGDVEALYVQEFEVGIQADSVYGFFEGDLAVKEAVHVGLDGLEVLLQVVQSLAVVVEVLGHVGDVILITYWGTWFSEQLWIRYWMWVWICLV